MYDLIVALNLSKKKKKKKNHKYNQQSNKIVALDWLPSKNLIEVVGYTLFLTPFISNGMTALAAGLLARSHVHTAEILTQVLYILWFFHCTLLSTTVFIAGIRLSKLLNEHLSRYDTTGPRYITIKKSIIKIHFVITIIVGCIMSYGVFCLIYGIMRREILQNYTASIAYGAVWNLLGVVSTIGVEFTILIK
jgi:hypothetical protein